jgi:thioredoxin-dependent peroxiredoxin
MKPGEQVPDFETTLEDGRSVRLSTLLDAGPIVLFFYPKAFTAGCTAEACHFRDLAQEFARVGAQRFGVSRDDVGTQARFAQEHGLDYPLMSDPDGTIARIFGAKRLGPIWSKRQTFVVGTDRTLLGVIASETDMERHADEALQLLQEQMA